MTMHGTQWAVTVPTQDGWTYHLLTPHRTGADLIVLYLVEELGPLPEGSKVEEVPLTWECDGRDNCRAMA